MILKLFNDQDIQISLFYDTTYKLLHKFFFVQYSLVAT